MFFFNLLLQFQKMGPAQKNIDIKLQMKEFNYSYQFMYSISFYEEWP
jgi:hypothetical protein